MGHRPNALPFFSTWNPANVFFFADKNPSLQLQLVLPFTPLPFYYTLLFGLFSLLIHIYSLISITISTLVFEFSPLSRLGPLTSILLVNDEYITF